MVRKASAASDGTQDVLKSEGELKDESIEDSMHTEGSSKKRKRRDPNTACERRSTMICSKTRAEK